MALPLGELAKIEDFCLRGPSPTCPSGKIFRRGQAPALRSRIDSVCLSLERLRATDGRPYTRIHTRYPGSGGDTPPPRLTAGHLPLRGGFGLA